MANPLVLSPDAAPSVLHFGTECQAMVIVDNALADPDAVIAIAARHSYRPIGPYYPGLRAAVSERVAMELVVGLEDVLVAAFALAARPRYFECYLSLVTLPPEALAPIQRLPHFDGLEQDRIAVLLYLDRAERAGTAFYRQRATGFETVDAARYDAYRSTLDAAVEDHGIPPPAYIAGDTPLFEQIHMIDGRFNRMIAYRGNTLHCAALEPDFLPVADPAKGRLTLNLFLRADSPD